VNKPEAINTVKKLLMMSESIAQNMQSSQGTINYPTQLHLVGHFPKSYPDAQNHEYQKCSDQLGSIRIMDVLARQLAVLIFL
jgi:hypothetical protein